MQALQIQSGKPRKKNSTERNSMRAEAIMRVAVHRKINKGAGHTSRCPMQHQRHGGSQSRASVHAWRTGGVGIGALHKLEEARGVNDEVLGPAREVRHVQGHKVERVQHIVPVRHSVHGVGADSADEAQLARNELAVHAEGIARQCS